MSASSKVFGTVELFENIFDHVPLLTIVHGRRVNRKFRNIIDDSPPLQRALFLKEDDSIAKSCWAFRSVHGDPWDGIVAAPERDDRWAEDQYLGDRFLFNPLLFENDSDPDKGYITELKVLLPDRLIQTIFQSLLPDKLDMAHCGPMFVSKPALTTVYIEMIDEGKGPDSGLRRQICVYHPQGVRFRDMVNAAPSLPSPWGPWEWVVRVPDGVHVVFVSDEQRRTVEGER